MNKDKTLTRNQIQQLYIDWNIQEATRDELENFLANEMNNDLNMLDDRELVKEVRLYAPHIVEGITLSIS